MILGLLAGRGPMHGRQIRRAAELTNAEVWGGIGRSARPGPEPDEPAGQGGGEGRR
jgi:hypothetical protein